MTAHNDGPFPQRTGEDRDALNDADLARAWEEEKNRRRIHGRASDMALQEAADEYRKYIPPAEGLAQALADEAVRIVGGARNQAYGKPERNFERIARFWTAYFQNTGRDITITPADVSPLMRLMKEARLCESPQHYDSHVDLIGYTLTGAEVSGVKIP